MATSLGQSKFYIVYCIFYIELLSARAEINIQYKIFNPEGPMYCPRCGWQNDDAADKCANCFTDLRAHQTPQQPQPIQQTQQMPSQPPYTQTQQMPGQPPYAQPQQPYGQPVYTQPPPHQQYMGPQAGQVYVNYQAAQIIPDHLVWSIIVTVLTFCTCFGILAMPFGILAIAKSAQCSSKKSQGDYYGALSDSNTAKMWIWITVGILVFLGLFIGLLIGLSRSDMSTL